MPLPPPADEPARLAALRRLAILDTPAEEAFDDLTRLAAHICGTPISLVSLLDTGRQWFKSRHGLDATETPRAWAFCDHAVRQAGVFEVTDAAADGRFADNPLVTGDPRIRFYAGVPLEADGVAVGTLCVIDRTPRTLSPAQRDALRTLGRQVATLFQLRRHAADQAREHETFRALFEYSSDAYLIYTDAGGIVDCNRAAVDMLRRASRAEVIGTRPRDFSPEFQPCGRRSAELVPAVIAAARRDGVCRFDWTHRRADGEEFPTQVTLTPAILGGRDSLLVVWHDLSDRKRAEDALRASEERFVAFMDASPVAAFMKDDAGRYTYINQPIVRRFGHPAEFWLGKTDAELFPAAYSETWRENDRRVLAGGRVEEFSESVPMDDGGLSHWTTYKFPFRDAGGRTYLAGIGLDVTEKRETEEAVRESEGRFRGAFDHAPIGMALVAPDGRWLKVNRAVCDIFGHTPDELLATDFQTLTHPDDLGADLTLVGQTLAGEIDSYQMEKRYVHKGGAVIHALLAVSLVRDAGGRPLYFVSQIEDITARKRAEVAVRESEAKFRLTLDRLGEGVFVVEPTTGRFAESNAAVLRMLGYTADELAALRVTDVIAREPAEVVERNMAAIDRALAADGRCDLGRKHLRRKDGSEVAVEVRIAAVRHAGGELHAVTVRDMTEQDEYEERLLAYQTELERANAQLRTRATTDALTGVRNRAAFNDRLREEYDRAARTALPLSAVLLDVDHFKGFNDAFGHPAGDDVLVRVAGLLAETVRGTDFVARYGGEEFAILLPDTDRGGALVLAERCRRAVAGAEWDRRGITISVGVSTLSPSTPDAAALVKEADDALYRSKHAGRNRVSHHTNLLTQTPAPRVVV